MVSFFYLSVIYSFVFSFILLLTFSFKLSETEQYIRDMFNIGIDTDEDMDKTISFIDNE
jgi:hypothetical protein